MCSSDNIMVVCSGKIVDRVQGRFCKKVLKISTNVVMVIALPEGSHGRL